jgi:hypothetical protein
VRWQQALPDERWLAAPPEELARWSLELNAGRFRMLLEDLAALPAQPGIVVEGTPLLPWLAAPHVASPRHAVWLVPTPEFGQARLTERSPLAGFLESSDPDRAAENRIAREHVFTEAIAAGARELGLPVVHVDGSRDLAATAAEVEERLGPALEGLPGAATAEERTALRREENAALLRQVLLHLEAHPTVRSAEGTGYEFACECGASGCDETVRLGVHEYEHARSAVHPAHARRDPAR